MSAESNPYSKLTELLLRRHKVPRETLLARLQSPAKEQFEPKPKELKRYYRRIDMKLQSLIVLCRYGELKYCEVPLNSIYIVS
jgi:hypothetical protein